MVVRAQEAEKRTFQEEEAREEARLRAEQEALRRKFDAEHAAVAAEAKKTEAVRAKWGGFDKASRPGPERVRMISPCLRVRQWMHAEPPRLGSCWIQERSLVTVKTGAQTLISDFPSTLSAGFASRLCQCMPCVC